MRFLRLDLRAFGPFADAPPIDLSGGTRGLHLIHGPNEAGKSTTLRAIRCLLFGFPTRLDDNHRHPYKDLRIGATLQSEQKTEIAFLRRKGDIRTIRTLDDEGLVADDQLQKFLGGIDQAKFDEFFAMDHAELLAGGRAIVEGKGNLGSMLFAAGSGLAGIDEVRKALDVEMEELFKPTGRNPSINQGLAQLREAREASEKAMLATSDWVDIDATLARERARKQAVDVRIREVETERRQLERLRDALPLIEKIDRLAAVLAGFGTAPVLSEEFADRRSDALAARIAGARAAETAQAAIEEINRELEALGARDPILDEADAIRRIRDDLGLYRKAVEDRPIEQSRLARRETDARAILAELRPGASLEDTDSLRIPALLKGRVQSLSEELAGLQAGLRNAETEVARLLAANPGTDPRGVTDDAHRRSEALAQAIRQGESQGNLETQLASALEEITRLQERVAIDLQALPLWSGSHETLEALAVPSTATIDRFENEFRDADKALGKAEVELSRLEAEIARIQLEIDRQQTAGSVPTEEDLRATRSARDSAWSQVRRAWLEGEPIEAPARLADAYEAAVKTSDDLADRLRREADAVAEQAQKLWRRRELADLIAGSVDARDQARSARDNVLQAWLATWEPLGIAALTPREMKDWVAIHRAELVRQARELRDRKLERDRIAAKVEAFKDQVGRHLEGLGEAPADPREPLSALLARASAMVKRVSAGLSLHEARLVRDRAAEALAEARTRWASVVQPLGLGADSTPSEAQTVIARFEDLAAIVREIGETRTRIEDQDRVETRFRAAIHALIGRLGIEPAGSPVESIARELDDRLKSALVGEARREESLKRIKAEREKLESARNERNLADAALEALMAEAGCDSLDGLVPALRISDEIRERKKELRSHEEQLELLAGTTTVEKLREQAEGVDPETLESRVIDLIEQLTPLSEDRDRLGEVIVRCQVKLEAMDGGPAAADAQQLVEEQLAHLASDVERYARLKLASAVLREAVERYRKEHQTPVLSRAGLLFSSLTAGSFLDLKTDLDDRGEPVLLGHRADGSRLKVEAMSEGTADQLYLSLRLASLQTYLDNHEPMPVVVDDILVNFDNARALAALKALGELSSRTQVLFFTHHEHLVDLAREALPADVLFVHHLSFPPESITLNGATSDAPKPKRRKKAAEAVED